MAIAFDAASALQSFTATHSYTHTPVGTPRGVVVAVVQVESADEVSGVTYGGVAMTEVAGSPLVDASGEASVVYTYFLGASVPTGAQTVEITCTAANLKAAISYTLTAAADTEVEDTSTVTGLQANPVCDLTTGAGVETWCALAFHSGIAAFGGITPTADYTSVAEHDYGTETAGFYRRTDIATGGTVTCGWTQAADDANGLSIAVKEAAGGTAHTQTVTDPVGLLDAAGQAGTADRAVTDPVGLLDGAAALAVSERTLTDPAGLLDAASALLVLQATVTDPVGIGDAAAQQHQATQTHTDPAGLLDAASALLVLQATVTDPVGIGDAVSALTGIEATITDAVGVRELVRRTTVQSHDISVLVSP